MIGRQPARPGRLAFLLAAGSIASFWLGLAVMPGFHASFDQSGAGRNVALLITAVPGALWVIAAFVLGSERPRDPVQAAGLGLYGLAFLLPAGTYPWVMDGVAFPGFFAFAWGWIAAPWAWAANAGLLIALELRRRDRIRGAFVVITGALLLALGAALPIWWTPRVEIGFAAWVAGLAVVGLAIARVPYARPSTESIAEPAVSGSNPLRDSKP